MGCLPPRRHTCNSPGRHEQVLADRALWRLQADDGHPQGLHLMAQRVGGALDGVAGRGVGHQPLAARPPRRAALRPRRRAPRSTDVEQTTCGAKENTVVRFISGEARGRETRPPR